MKISAFPAAQLRQDHIDAWSAIQRGSETFGSPYFRPEFTQAVAAVRNDVEVAVLQDRGEMVGFFPYQRSRGDVARPVGGRMSDFQGVVIRKGVAWDAVELLHGCRLKAWRFDHLLASQEPLRPYHQLIEDSPYADLSGGFEGYLGRQGRALDNPFPNIATKRKRLQRDVGPLRFEFHTEDQRVFDTLIEWKTQQYLRTNATNVFAFPWTRALLERVFRCRGEEFAGVLSALFVGDRLVAARFSMRSNHVLHEWFPVYDPELANYSVGKIRDVETYKAASLLGIRRIDFGKGINEQKDYFMSGATQVAVGSVDLRPVTRVLRRQWQRAYDWARRSPLRRPARVPARVLYRVREWFAFR